MYEKMLELIHRNRIAHESYCMRQIGYELVINKTVDMWKFITIFFLFSCILRCSAIKRERKNYTD